MGVSLHYLLKRLEIELGRIVVYFKRKIAWVILQEIFGERITICFIERSSRE